MSSAFGRWLLELGALPDERALDDVLARQSERMPTASVAISRRSIFFQRRSSSRENSMNSASSRLSRSDSAMIKRCNVSRSGSEPVSGQLFDAASDGGERVLDFMGERSTEFSNGLQSLRAADEVIDLAMLGHILDDGSRPGTVGPLEQGCAHGEIHVAFRTWDADFEPPDRSAST